MIVGDFFKIRFAHRLNTQTAFNIWHYSVFTLTGTGVTDLEIATAIDATWGTFVPPLLTSAASYVGCGVQYLGASPPRLEVISIAGAAGGSGAANPLPQQISGLVNLVTGIAGKNQRGRKYLPFPGTDALSGTPDEGISAGYRGNLANLMGQMLPFIAVTGAGGTATLDCVLNTTYSASPRVVTTFNINSHFSQQKRRSALRRPDATFPF